VLWQVIKVQDLYIFVDATRLSCHRLKVAPKYHEAVILKDGEVDKRRYVTL
jgi:hypothetical protein